MVDNRAWPILRRLARWVQRFDVCFDHPAQRTSLATYLQGLLGDSTRKSMQAMLARVSSPIPYQAFQHFVTHAPWDARPVWRRLLEVLPERSGILIVDDTGFPKQGRQSVGVTRQYTDLYRRAQAIPFLDFDLIAENPKPLVGFSDLTALHVAIRHPNVVRKLILASVSYTLSGIHPGLMEGLGDMTPEMMYGSSWHAEYMKIAPHPEHFARLFAKKTEMDRQTRDIPAENIKAIQAPTLLIIGDSDLIRPEHAVEMFRLLGGGVFGDTPAGLPNSQLAVLPGTSHVTVVDRSELLVPMIASFLAAPIRDNH